MGLFILGFVVYRIGPGTIYGALKHAQVRYLLIVPLVTLSVFLVQALKWNYILKNQEIFVEFRKIFKLILIGIFYGSITPAQAGGLIKIKYLKSYCQKSLSECASSVIVDKMIDLASLCFFVTVGLIVMGRHTTGINIPLFFVACFFVVLFVLYSKERLKRLFDILPFSFLPEKIHQSLRRSFTLFYSNIPHKKMLVVPLLLSLLSWLLVYTQIFLIAKALSIQVPYLVFIFVIAIATLIALAPITINGIGTKEVALIMILSVYQIAPERIVGMSLLNLGMCIYTPALIGGLLSIQQSEAKKE